MFVECRHILPSGRKCHSPALRGKPFCFYHAKLHFRTPVPRKLGKSFQPFLEDPPAIQAAVAKALTALSSPLTDPRRAGLLLYGLNLAAGLSRHISKSKVREPIEIERECLALELIESDKELPGSGIDS